MRNFNLDFLTNFSYVGYCTLLYIGSVKVVIQSVLNYGDYNIIWIRVYLYYYVAYTN